MAIQNHDDIDTIFARRIDGKIHLLYETDGQPVTRAPVGWPTLWPEDSEVSAGYEHPEGIVLSDEEFAKISDVIEMDDQEF